MNNTLFTLAVIQIIISIILAVCILFVSHKMLIKLFFKEQEIKNDHLAFTIFSCGIFISIGIILSEIIPSISNIIRLSFTQNNIISFTDIISYSGIYLFTGFVFALLINLATFLLFSALTKGINEFKEIKENNLSVALLVVSTLISITLIIKDSISSLIESLIPYQETLNFLTN